MLLRRLTLTLVAALGLALICGAATAQARLALIIGNAAYQDLPDLQNTIDDAEAYRDTFSKLGYQVSFYHDLDLDAFSEAVDQFTTSIAAGDTVVVVYTGHGWSDGRENFLIPTDAPISGSETKLRGASFPLRDGQNGLLDLIDAAGAGLSVAIIDACRNNPFAAKPGTRSVGYSRGLAPVSAPNGSFVIFSAGEGQEALDRLPDDPPDQKLSVFTRNLAPLLQSGAFLEDAIAEAQLETATMAATVDGHLQHPAYYDQTLGKTCLSGQCQDLDRIAAAEPAPPVVQPIDEQNPLIVACDAAAASPTNPDNPNGFAGVLPEQIDTAAAASACTAAVTKFPDHARSGYNLARVKAAQGDDLAAVALLQPLAGQEYPAAVFALAESYGAGAGVAKNADLAARYYQIACKLGHQTACDGGAKGPVTVEPAVAQNVATQDHTCGGSDVSGCADLGVQQVAAEDFAAAQDSFAKACDAAVASACRDLGNLVGLGKGGMPDPVRAGELMTKACDLADGQACHAIGWGYYQQADYAQSIGYFKTGCDLGNGAACTMLGYQSELGNGADPDSRVAVAYYHKGCLADDPTGCEYEARVWTDVYATDDNRALAIDPAKKACDLGAGMGCTIWGNVLAKGEASPQTDLAIVDAYQRGCDLKSGNGCAALGMAYHRGSFGVPQIEAKAKDLLQSGCNMPNAAEACQMLASYATEEMKGDPAGPDLYVDAAIKACDGGYGDRCVELALFDFGPARPRSAVDLLVQGLQLKSTLPKQVLSTLDKNQTALLQQALGQLGLYKGAADGKRGPATVAALNAVYAP
ncbi:MAG: caspase family protein [Cypionkella sp.]